MKTMGRPLEAIVSLLQSTSGRLWQVGNMRVGDRRSIHSTNEIGRSSESSLLSRAFLHAALAAGVLPLPSSRPHNPKDHDNQRC